MTRKKAAIVSTTVGGLIGVLLAILYDIKGSEVLVIVSLLFATTMIALLFYRASMP